MVEKAHCWQHQGGLSITRVVVVVFASLRGFMTVCDLDRLAVFREAGNVSHADGVSV